MPKCSIWRIFEYLKLEVKQCYHTKIGGKCQNWKTQITTFLVILKHCVFLWERQVDDFFTSFEKESSESFIKKANRWTFSFSRILKFTACSTCVLCNIITTPSLGTWGKRKLSRYIEAKIFIAHLLKTTRKTGTVFENRQKRRIQYCERSELRIHFEWTKVNQKCQEWAILVTFLKTWS